MIALSRLIPAAAVCALFVSGPCFADPDERQAATRIEQGWTLYAANCARCHGETGTGDGPDAAPLEARPPDFRRTDILRAHSDEELVARIRGGLSWLGPGAVRRPTHPTPTRSIDSCEACPRSHGPSSTMVGDYTCRAAVPAMVSTATEKEWLWTSRCPTSRPLQTGVPRECDRSRARDPRSPWKARYARARSFGGPGGGATAAELRAGTVTRLRALLSLLRFLPRPAWKSGGGEIR